MHVFDWRPEPIHEVRYRYARSGGGTSAGLLAITCATFKGLPARVEGMILTADLQGRELLPPKKKAKARHGLIGEEGSRLLGEVVAQELAGLSAQALLPPSDRTGVVLGGDFWTQPGSEKRGGAGDVSPVWKAFRKHFRWVVGVLGNHDQFGAVKGHNRPPAQSDRWSLLDGGVVTVDGVRIGGVGGIIGSSSKPHRKQREDYIAALNGVLASHPDLVVLHTPPEVPEAGLRGDTGVRECLEAHPPTLVVCGHCYWQTPLHLLPNGTQICNVDSRVVVLRRLGVKP
jgi:Icc-related predicted phosphoesterase